MLLLEKLHQKHKISAKRLITHIVTEAFYCKMIAFGTEYTNNTKSKIQENFTAYLPNYTY